MSDSNTTAALDALKVFPVQFSPAVEKVRMLPPLTANAPQVVGARASYAPHHGRAVDVHAADVEALEAAGWIVVAPSGGKFNLPDAPEAGDLFVDTTHGALIYDAKARAWRSISTGLAIP